MALLVVVMGTPACSSDESSDADTPASPDDAAVVRLDGPLESVPAGAGGVYVVPQGEIVRDPGLATALDHSGDRPITLGGASFLDFEDRPSPELVDAWVDEEALEGYVIAPGDPAPDLVLSVRSSDEIAINRLLQISYSVDGDAATYAAIFDLHWVVCDQAKVTERVCGCLPGGSRHLVTSGRLRELASGPPTDGTT